MKNNDVLASAATETIQGDEWETRQWTGRLLPSKYIKVVTPEPAEVPVVTIGVLTPMGVVPVVATSQHTQTPLAA